MPVSFPPLISPSYLCYPRYLFYTVLLVLFSFAGTIPLFSGYLCHLFYMSPTCCWYGTIPLLSCNPRHLFYTVLLILFHTIHSTHLQHVVGMVLFRFCSIVICIIYSTWCCWYYSTPSYSTRLWHADSMVLFCFSLVICAIYSTRCCWYYSAFLWSSVPPILDISHVKKSSIDINRYLDYLQE